MRSRSLIKKEFRPGILLGVTHFGRSSVPHPVGLPLTLSSATAPRIVAVVQRRFVAQERSCPTSARFHSSSGESERSDAGISGAIRGAKRAPRSKVLRTGTVLIYSALCRDWRSPIDPSPVL